MGSRDPSGLAPRCPRSSASPLPLWASVPSVWRREHVDPRPGLWRALCEVQTPVHSYLPSVGHEAAGFLQPQQLPVPATVPAGDQPLLATPSLLPAHGVTRVWGWSRQRGPRRHSGSHKGTGTQAEAMRSFTIPRRALASQRRHGTRPHSHQQSGHRAPGTGLEAWAPTHFLLTRQPPHSSPKALGLQFSCPASSSPSQLPALICQQWPRSLQLLMV